MVLVSKPLKLDKHVKGILMMPNAPLAQTLITLAVAVTRGVNAATIGYTVSASSMMGGTGAITNHLFSTHNAVFKFSKSDVL